MAAIHKFLRRSLTYAFHLNESTLEDLAVYFVEPAPSPLYSIEQGFASIYPAYAMMARCTNAVFVDRTSIFANVCRFPLALLSSKIEIEENGYSTCILALVMANFYPSREERATAMYSRAHDRILELRIAQVLRSVVDDKPIGPRFAGISSRENARPKPLWEW